MSVVDRIKTLQDQKRMWSDKMLYIGHRVNDTSKFVKVQIVKDDPPDEVIINFADNWLLNFGGEVLSKYYEDGKNFALVEVYMD